MAESLSLEELLLRNKKLKEAVQQKERAEQEERDRLLRENAEMERLLRENAELERQLLGGPGGVPSAPAVPAPLPAMPVYAPPPVAPHVLPVPAVRTAEEEEIRMLRQQLAQYQALLVPPQPAAPAPAPAPVPTPPVPAAPAVPPRTSAEDEDIKRLEKQLAELRRDIETNPARPAGPAGAAPAAPAAAAAGSVSKSDTVVRMVEENKRLIEQINGLDGPKKSEAEAKADTVARLEAENRRIKELIETKTREKTLADARAAMRTHILKVVDTVTSIDLVIVMDCTGSMRPWMEEAKTKLLDIVDKVQKDYPSITLRVGFVGYRDHSDGADRLVMKDLTSDAAGVRELISAQVAKGGGDEPEDVAGGIDAAVRFTWQAGTRVLVHIADAPAHGTMYNDCRRDDYPGGDPHGLTLEPLMQQLGELWVDYVFFKVNKTSASTNKMLDVMAAAYRDDQNLRELVVEDLDTNVALFSERITKTVRSSVERSVKRSELGRGGPLPPSVEGRSSGSTPAAYLEPRVPPSATGSRLPTVAES